MKLRLAGLGLFLAVLGLATVPGSAQDQPVLVPERLPEAIRDRLRAERDALIQRQAALVAKTRAHNEKCRQVPAASALAAECREALAILQAEIRDYSAAIGEFNARVTRVHSSPPDQNAGTTRPRPA